MLGSNPSGISPSPGARGLLLAVALCLISCGGGGDAGNSESSSTRPLAGTLDLTFGVAGKLLVPQTAISEMKVDVAGNTYVGSSLNSVIFKIGSQGHLDAAFGSAGQINVPASAMVFDPGGDLYAVGNWSQPRAVFTRFDTAGRLNATFGDGGQTRIAPLAYIDALLRDGAGNLYGVGTTLDIADRGVVVVKVDASGHLVTSFGEDGAVRLPMTGGVSIFGASLDSRGDILIAGGDASDLLFTMKVDALGHLVGSYGTGGRWVSEPCMPVLSQPGASMALDSNDNAYIVATCASSGMPSARVIKLDATGKPATGFGEAGTRSNLFEDVPSRPSGATAVLLDASGNVYVAGTLGNYWGVGECRDSQDVAIVKMDASGRVLEGFGNGGRAVIDLGGYDLGAKIGQDGTGRLYVGAWSRACPTQHPSLLPFIVIRVRN